VTGLSAAQLAMRSTGIGGSEIAAVVGLSEYDSPLDVYRRKRGLEDEKLSTEAMEAGNRLEPAICDWAGDALGLALVPSDTLRHPDNDWMFATPDRLVRGQRSGLQAKNVGIRMAHKWGETDDAIPDEYRVQVEWEMEVASLDLMYVAALIGGQRLRIYTIRRDDEIVADIVGKARSFWFDHVLAGNPPPIDGSDRTRQRIQREHPTANGLILPGTAEVEALARTYLTARDAEKAAQRAKTEAGNRLRKLIGDAAGYVGREWKATWTGTENGKPDWKAIAEEMGATEAVIAKHTPPGGRTLRVSLKGQK
jgi:putative phage-type endonuclease